MQKHSEDSLLLDSKWLTIEDFEYLCFDFTREKLSHDEPIPDYSTRDNALLESALGSPCQTFDGILLYPTIVEQAAILFYAMIKNHPFRNGNKRIAVMSLLVFLLINNKWLSISPYNLYRLALFVSKSKPKSKENVVNAIEEIIKSTLRSPKDG